MLIAGISASGGRSALTWFTRALMSASALAASKFSLSRTLLYTVITVPLSIAGGLGLAMLVNRRIYAVGLWRTLFYAPSVVPVVASAIMWKLMFDHDAGAINAVVELLGGRAISWLLDPTVFYALIIMVLWGMGGGMVISLAGLQGVPLELQEAARVDGAGAWHRFFHITLPMISPVLFFQCVTSMIYAMQTLVQPLLLSETKSFGTYATAVQRSNYLYMIHVYEQFFANQRFGYGSALLWVLFLFILVITLVIFRSGALWVYYEVDQDKS